MRLERLNENKIKIFLTLDDLFDRGLSNEDIWKDSLKWHQLFHDMLEEASETFDVDNTRFCWRGDFFHASARDGYDCDHG